MIYIYFFGICLFIYLTVFINKFYQINKNQFLLIIKNLTNKRIHLVIKNSIFTIIINFILRLIKKIIFKI